MGLISAIIDVREPEWVKGLKFGNTPTATSLLDAGDLLCATDSNDMLIIERKTASDLLNTLKEDRLFPQISRMREVSSWAYLVICGELRPGIGGKCIVDGRESGWNWASVSGALLTVQEAGVYVVQVGSDMDFEQAIIRLGNRDRAGLRVTPPRDAMIVSEAEAIIASLPGIGVEKAGAILDYAQTAAMALQVLTDLTVKHPIPGIAEGIKRNVRKALGLEGEDILIAADPNTLKIREVTTV